MRYRIVLTIIALAVFAFVAINRMNDAPAPAPTVVTPTDEPAMKGLQIN